MDTTIQDSLNIMAQHTQNNVSDGRVDSDSGICYFAYSCFKQKEFAQE